ncbi:MAG: urease accessory protein UreD [Luteolibacter sp.]
MTGNSVGGHLRLRCETRDDGVPYVAEQSFQAPVHLSKSHLDGSALIVTVVNPTAGFFDGDKLTMDITVGSGANLVMSTPSSSRVFRTRSGEPAVCDQHFRVAKDAFMEWIPEPFIPHSGASYEQRTTIDLEEGAALLFIDWISPGRVARGEVFQYKNLRWELDLNIAGKLSARERYDMPGEGLEGVTAMFEAGHYVSVFVSGKMAEYWPAEELEALGNEDVYLGFGGLEGGAMVLRALCRDSLAARRLIETLRVVLYRSAGMKVPGLGRIFI